jgi:lysine 6-dehydrogenase
MKVVALGGAGDVGQAVVRAAIALPAVDEIVVADRRLDEARALVETLDPRRVMSSAHHIDVTATSDLEMLLRDADVVLNMVGPFYRFGTPILDAAIKTRTHYLDICDDWEPTPDLLSRHAAAQAAGVTAVIGMGASPGALNLLARQAAGELDEVHQLYTAWPIDIPMPGAEAFSGRADPPSNDTTSSTAPSAAIVHWMQQVSGQIRTISAGREVDSPPLEQVRLEYPGFGVGTAYTVGHPEPLTLFRSLGVRGESACLMIVTPQLAAAADALRRAIDAGDLTIEQAAAQIAGSQPPPLTTATLEGYPSHGALPTFFALARGIRKGRPEVVGARVTDFPLGLPAATGLPLVVVLQQLLEGRLGKHGVFPPEQIIDCDAFFADLVRLWRPGVGAPESIVVIDRSW